MYIETKYVLHLSFTTNKICRAFFPENVASTYYLITTSICLFCGMANLCSIIQACIQLPQFNPRAGHISICTICFVERKIVPENTDPGWSSSATKPSLYYHWQLNKIIFFSKYLKFVLLAFGISYNRITSLVIP